MLLHKAIYKLFVIAHIEIEVKMLTALTIGVPIILGVGQADGSTRILMCYRKTIVSVPFRSRTVLWR